MAARADSDAPRATDPRYGEFPHLFWDLAPEAPVDIANDVILARLLVHGRIADLRRTQALRVAPHRLATLAIPEHIRRFWQKVFAESRGG